MVKFVATVRVEVDIDDTFIQQGYEEADMVEHEVSSALNGKGLEWEINEVKRGSLYNG